jgi:hypothetical protein
MDEQLVFRHILREPAQPPKEQMNATDFRQLADRITQFFPVELHEGRSAFWRRPRKNWKKPKGIGSGLRSGGWAKNFSGRRADEGSPLYPVKGAIEEAVGRLISRKL